MAKGRTGRDWDGQNLANIDKYTRQIKSLFNSIAGEAALIGSSVDTVNPDRLFTFADYPKTKQRADKLISNLQNDLNTIIVNGVRSSWTLSNNKNNELARQVFGNNVGKLSKAEYRRYFSNNGVALDQFINRKENGLNLSDRVWRYSQQFKKEIEMGLDIGIGNGLSADQMARDLKQYLQFPDKLFRRVRDKHGELQLSKAAQAFHPGAGVYRSSYKNAMRLSRTENNMAYRASDHERWNEFDFVVGFEIRLSNNPNHCPMCEALAGKYPKTFKFVSWHPQCRCSAIPILKTVDELAEETKAILAGEPTTTESSRKITDLPPNFKSWMNDNKERLARAKSKPYFLRDNEGLIRGKNEGGISQTIQQKIKLTSKIINEKGYDPDNLYIDFKAIEDGLPISAHRSAQELRKEFGEPILIETITGKPRKLYSKEVDYDISDFGKKNLDKKFELLTAIEVDVSKLEFPQRAVFEKPLLAAKNKAAFALEIEGRYYIIDGNHSAMKQILEGKSKIELKVIKWDKQNGLNARK